MLVAYLHVKSKSSEVVPPSNLQSMIYLQVIILPKLAFTNTEFEQSNSAVTGKAKNVEELFDRKMKVKELANPLHNEKILKNYIINLDQ